MVAPKPNSTIQLTESGFEKLKGELEDLVDNKRPAAVDRLSQARSMGDLSENSDYHQAKEQLEFIDGRISELESVLNQAVVVKGEHSTKEVGVGAKVKVSIKGKEHAFNIVGEWEADPKEKKISHESPLGKALIGRKVGETVEVDAPAGKVEYTIVGIE